jgi:hypothetical protein
MFLLRSWVPHRHLIFTRCTLAWLHREREAKRCVPPRRACSRGPLHTVIIIAASSVGGRGDPRASLEAQTRQTDLKAPARRAVCRILPIIRGR